MTEMQLQTQIMGWAGYRSIACHELSLLFHVPNEGKRSVITGSLLKKAGLRSGVPDLILPVPSKMNGKKYHGLFIELKNGHKKPTENQMWWLENLSQQDYLTAVCESFESAVALISYYLDIESGIAIPATAWDEFHFYGKEK